MAKLLKVHNWLLDDANGKINVFFLLVIVLSVLLWFHVPDYTFGIFQLFFLKLHFVLLLKTNIIKTGYYINFSIML
jgi:hypothetical protein